MDIQTLVQALRERIAQLAKSEKDAWANLGSVIGAREELEKLLAELDKQAGGEEPPAIPIEQLLPGVSLEKPEPIQ
jgi:hypothetical protein